MKKLLSALLAIGVLVLSGCGDDTITTGEVTDRCSDLAGTYSGWYDDTSCDGDHSKGSIDNYTITDGCTTEITDFIIAVNGEITNMTYTDATKTTVDSFNVQAATPPGSSCGGLTGNCTLSGTNAYNCSYSWQNGGSGTINVTKH